MYQYPIVNHNPAFAWELRANYLRSMGKKDVEKLIGPKPDMEATDGDLYEENMKVSQEQPLSVGAKDNHVQHMNGHAQFKREHFKDLTPEALKLLTMHILEHRQVYQQQIQEQALLQQQGGQGGKAGVPNGVTGFTPAQGLGGVSQPSLGGQGAGIQGPKVSSYPGAG